MTVIDLIMNNWEAAALLIGAVAVLFFPKYAGLISKLSGLKQDPTTGKIQPIDTEGLTEDKKILVAVEAANLLIKHFVEVKDPEAELAAREAAKELFTKKPTEDAK